MNPDILNTEIQEFIIQNLNTDIPALLLKHKAFKGVAMRELAEQIESKRRIKDKLPTWFNNNRIYYPSSKNLEQSSSEITARYKSGLISGKTLADLTGGFGVDACHFSRSFDSVIYCEIDPALAAITAHNFKVLGAKNIRVRTTDGMRILPLPDVDPEWLYIDPSRRHESKGRVFRLKDCKPDIVTHMEFLLKQADHLLIKLSPMLDLTSVINEIKNIKAIHIVAVRNEVKELLLIVEKNFDKDIRIFTRNFVPDGVQAFDFYYSEEEQADLKLDNPSKYLYEPNAAIMKSGAFKLIAERFKLKKLHKHAHLYTSDTPYDFPGRQFVIEDILPFSDKNKLRVALEGKQANISVRHFPMKPDRIKSKFKIKDGGERYLFFTTTVPENRVVLFCRK
ncbi:MAG: class I SAM-dependent methyltransferase [Bacteroidia bacterium]|nr:class I SAM-dependent methyltransferase [Bacteroidia bacterium]